MYLSKFFGGYIMREQIERELFELKNVSQYFSDKLNRLISMVAGENTAKVNRQLAELKKKPL
jgi:hypothetical protein